MAKMLYRKDTGEILGVHIIGLHAADLIHEASNAIATKQTVQVRRGASARGRVCVCVWWGRGEGDRQAVQSILWPSQIVRSVGSRILMLGAG